jgi:hypothetical protein
MCEYTKVCLKNTIIWKVTRIVLKALCQKSILCDYQNAKWNEKKLAPKKYKMYPKKYIFLPKMYNRSVLSPKNVNN